MIGRDGVDLVLADHALPGVSGFDFLRIVRENYPLAEFVMLADAPDVDAAVAGGEARRVSLPGQVGADPRRCSRSSPTPRNGRT